MRLFSTIGIEVGYDQGTRGGFKRDANDLQVQVQTDSYPDYVSGTCSLPQDGSVVSLALGALRDVRGLYLELIGGETLVWVNVADVEDSTTPGSLRIKGASSTQLGRLYLDGKVTSLSLSGPLGASVSGTYVAWGFITPPQA